MEKINTVGNKISVKICGAWTGYLNTTVGCSQSGWLSLDNRCVCIGQVACVVCDMIVEGAMNAEQCKF